MKSFVLSLSLLAAALSPASANPLEAREAQMKERGRLLGSLSPIVKGEQPYDASKVMDALEALAANADADLQVLWPAGSDMGDTTASPKIWEDFSGFHAADEKYRADIAAAIAANPQDAAALAPVFGGIASNCGGCHEVFRLKRG
ncbi:MAG: cytochrome c [Mesorhizobium sp.]|nr:cytochrome c [Mesorhizobium sp.]